MLILQIVLILSKICRKFDMKADKILRIDYINNV